MIYYVEDDKNIRDLVLYTLNHTGFDARGFEKGCAFWAALEKEKPELILLDIMLPGEDGLSLLRRLKSDEAYQAIPILMLTARSTEYDKVVGLDLGADDYLTKPFGIMELVSRVRELMRRSPRKRAQAVLVAGDISLDPVRHEVLSSGREVNLTFKEFELLRALMESRGQVFSRERLLERVWGYDYEGGTRTVDVHVQTLRQKLGAPAAVLETVRGVGYKICGEAKERKEDRRP